MSQFSSNHVGSSAQPKYVQGSFSPFSRCHHGLPRHHTHGQNGEKILDAGYPESRRQRYFDGFISQSMDTFYTRQPLQQTTFTRGTLDNFYTRHLLHQTPSAPHTRYTTQLLQPTVFTPGTLLTKNLLHQARFTPDTFYNRQFLQQAIFTPSTLYTGTVYTKNFYTRHLLHQTPFTTNNFNHDCKHDNHDPVGQTTTSWNCCFKRVPCHVNEWIRISPVVKFFSMLISWRYSHSLQQTTFTPGTLYTRNLLFTPGTFFTPDSFYNKTTRRA